MGALETKSPLGKSDPVTKTSSTTIESSNSGASSSGPSCATARALLSEKDNVSRKKVVEPDVSGSLIVPCGQSTV